MKMRIDLHKRTKEYALRVIKMYISLPKQTVAQVIGKQVLRSAPSVGAHYREACRAKSNADFIHKIESALPGIVRSQKLSALQEETNRLISIFVAMTKNVKAKDRKK